MAFWLGIHVCDSSLKNLLERTHMYQLMYNVQNVSKADSRQYPSLYILFEFCNILWEPLIYMLLDFNTILAQYIMWQIVSEPSIEPYTLIVGTHLA